MNGFNMCTYVHLSVLAGMYACMWRPEVSTGVSLHHSTLFCELGSLAEPGAHPVD